MLDYASNLGPVLDHASNLGPVLDYASNLGPVLDYARNLGPVLDYASCINTSLQTTRVCSHNFFQYLKASYSNLIFFCKNYVYHSYIFMYNPCVAVFLCTVFLKF